VQVPVFKRHFNICSTPTFLVMISSTGEILSLQTSVQSFFIELGVLFAAPHWVRCWSNLVLSAAPPNCDSQFQHGPEPSAENLLCGLAGPLHVGLFISFSGVLWEVCVTSLLPSPLLGILTDGKTMVSELIRDC
jgi:hypothetical protein